MSISCLLHYQPTLADSEDKDPTNKSWWTKLRMDEQRILTMVNHTSAAGCAASGTSGLSPTCSCGPPLAGCGVLAGLDLLAGAAASAWSWASGLASLKSCRALATTAAISSAAA